MLLYPFTLHWERCKIILQSSLHWTFSRMRRSVGQRYAAPEPFSKLILRKQHDAAWHIICVPRRENSLSSFLQPHCQWDLWMCFVAAEIARSQNCQSSSQNQRTNPPPPHHYPLETTRLLQQDWIFMSLWTKLAISVICMTFSLLSYVNSSFPGWRGRNNFLVAYIICSSNTC